MLGAGHLAVNIGPHRGLAQLISAQVSGLYFSKIRGQHHGYLAIAGGAVPSTLAAGHQR